MRQPTMSWAPPSQPAAMDPAVGSAVGAGVTAAGQAVGTVAQIAANAEAQKLALEQARLGRASSAEMAKAQIAAEQEMFAGRQRGGLQKMLLSAIQDRIGTTFQGRDLKRSANAGMDELLARAFLRRK